MVMYARFCVALNAAVLAALLIAVGLNSVDGRILMAPIAAAGLMTFAVVWFATKRRASRCNAKPDSLAPASFFLSLGLAVFPGYSAVLFIFFAIGLNTGYAVLYALEGIPAFVLFAPLGIAIFLYQTRAGAHRDQPTEPEPLK
jgi:hypothetical protein